MNFLEECRKPGPMDPELVYGTKKKHSKTDSDVDEFIFQTLRDFVLSTFNIVVEKEELIQAIQLIRMMKEYGINIHERYDTAIQQSKLYFQGYNKGLKDGIEKECNRVMDILQKGE